MKRIILFVCLSAIGFTACNKADDTPSDENTVNGKSLEGKWTPVKLMVTLKFDDGSVVNNNVPIESGDHMTFTYLKTEGNTLKGTYSTRGVGFDSSGEWLLEKQNNELTFSIPVDGQTIVIYRKVESVTANKLLLTADDRLVKLWAEVNDLNAGTQKKIIGGSAYEEYSK